MVSAPVPASRLLLEVFVSWGLTCTPQGHLPWTLPRGSLETLLSLVGLTGRSPIPMLGFKVKDIKTH